MKEPQPYVLPHAFTTVTEAWDGCFSRLLISFSLQNGSFLLKLDREGISKLNTQAHRGVSISRAWRYIRGLEVCNRIAQRLILSIQVNITLEWMPEDLVDGKKSTLVQVMAWWHQATSHYLNQCWPRSPCSMASLGHNDLKWQSLELCNCMVTYHCLNLWSPGSAIQSVAPFTNMVLL